LKIGYNGEIFEICYDGELLKKYYEENQGGNSELQDFMRLRGETTMTFFVKFHEVLKSSEIS
jgi:hypothetical protein